MKIDVQLFMVLLYFYEILIYFLLFLTITGLYHLQISKKGL